MEPKTWSRSQLCSRSRHPELEPGCRPSARSAWSFDKRLHGRNLWSALGRVGAIRASRQPHGEAAGSGKRKQRDIRMFQSALFTVNILATMQLYNGLPEPGFTYKADLPNYN